MNPMETWIREFPRQGLWVPEGIEEIKIREVRSAVVVGMGGSAMGGDLVRSMFEPDFRGPFQVYRDYGLPNLSPDTLVVTVSYSGNTEETLSAFEEASQRGYPAVAVSSGGMLKARAHEVEIPWIALPEGYAPRAALGYMVSLLVRLLVHVELLPPTAVDQMEEAFQWLASQEDHLTHSDALPYELAQKFYKRLPLLYASRRFLPVVERWRAQINENAKAFAHTAPLPEMNHNEIAGLHHPHRVMVACWATFLTFSDDSTRIHERISHTASLIYEDVLGWSEVKAQGPTTPAEVLWGVWVGDWTSLFLAQAYKEDPVAIERITRLKKALAQGVSK